MKYLRYIGVLFFASFSYYFLDKKIALYVYYELPKYLPPIATRLSFFALPGVYLALSVLSFIAFFLINASKKSTLFFFRMSLIVGFTMFVAGMLKLLSSRARPFIFIDEGIFGWDFRIYTDAFRSFPSSHTAIAFGLASLISYYHFRLKSLAFTIATFFACMRILSLKHFLSDAIIGALIGISIPEGVFWVESRLKEPIRKFLRIN